uniref:SFRICE_019643 n=1 Tax=Spodoptera frugiperda TaxID=7108 RepID=A0A2H1WNH9_SPOFR
MQVSFIFGTTDWTWESKSLDTVTLAPLETKADYNNREIKISVMYLTLQGFLFLRFKPVNEQADQSPPPMDTQNTNGITRFFSTKGVLCYVIVDVFGFHQSYSLLSTGGNGFLYGKMCAMDVLPTSLHNTSYTCSIVSVEMLVSTWGCRQVKGLLDSSLLSLTLTLASTKVGGVTNLMICHPQRGLKIRIYIEPVFPVHDIKGLKNKEMGP